MRKQHIAVYLRNTKRIDQSIKSCEGESRLLLVSLETTSI